MAEPKAITTRANGSTSSAEDRGFDPGPSLDCDQNIEAGAVTAHNELVLSGWAIAASGIAGVVVQFADRLLNATYGLDTPWIAESEPDLPGAERAGFELRLDTSDWTPGQRDVTIAAFDRHGGRAEIAGRIKILPYGEPKYSMEENRAAIAAGEVAMWVESPPLAEGPCEVDGRLEIRGWAYAAGGLETVRAIVDGQAFEALRPIARPDLLDELGPEAAEGAGFVLPVDPRECPPGWHTLTIVAIGKDGRCTGIAGDVLCAAEPAETPAEPKAPATIEWIENRSIPRPRGHGAELYDPEVDGGSALEAENQLRYRWVLGLARGRTILDACCGTGHGTALLAEAGAKRVCGIDEREEALVRARRLTNGLGVELKQGDLCSLPFDDSSFDLIACFGAIERVEDPELALEELRRVLRTDGVLLISAKKRMASGLPGYTGAELERLLRERFANVRLHRQRTSLASTVLDDEALSIGDGEADLEIDMRKLADDRPGGETHVIGVAGDGELPALGRFGMLASPRAIQRLHDSARTWEDRALLAEADAAATRVQSNLARMQQEATTKVLREREEEFARAAGAEKALVAARQQIEEQNGTLVTQNAMLAAKDERIAAQEAQIEQQQAQIEATGARLRQAEAAIASWERSISVRITGPIRAFKRGARRIRGALRRAR